MPESVLEQREVAGPVAVGGHAVDVVEPLSGLRDVPVDRHTVDEHVLQQDLPAFFRAGRADGMQDGELGGDAVHQACAELGADAARFAMGRVHQLVHAQEAVPGDRLHQRLQKRRPCAVPAGDDDGRAPWNPQVGPFGVLRADAILQPVAQREMNRHAPEVTRRILRKVFFQAAQRLVELVRVEVGQAALFPRRALQRPHGQRERAERLGRGGDGAHDTSGPGVGAVGDLEFGSRTHGFCGCGGCDEKSSADAGRHHKEWASWLQAASKGLLTNRGPEDGSAIASDVRRPIPPMTVDPISDVALRSGK